MKSFILAASLLLVSAAHASDKTDYLVQMASGTSGQVKLMSLVPAGTKVESLNFNNWYRVQLPSEQLATMNAKLLMQDKSVSAVEPNRMFYPMVSPSLAQARLQYQTMIELDPQSGLPFPGKGDEKVGAGGPGSDNPSIPAGGGSGSGSDPLFSKQWGMSQVNVKSAWDKSTGSPEVIVAVIDTGVDYTHEDLVANMWRNTKEIPNNNIDDDQNGYVDDIVGWDFVSKDNKPYDKYGSFTDILNGSNPGHGTHCAGNVAARAENGKGIAGVAPNVRIMALRFISDRGGGTTADAGLVIKYAVHNGAKVLSISCGAEVGDAKNSSEVKSWREAGQYAQDRGVLFIAAAGNGHQGRGYNNDTDRNPAYPASYDHENIISVAAINSSGAFGSFSNWGQRSVDLGAPGVKVFSTVPNNRYQDSIGSFLGQELTWDGTSMAAPHVAGAAALYWSAHPDKTWREVKAAILAGVKKTSQMNGKVSSGGQLDVFSMMNQ